MGGRGSNSNMGKGSGGGSMESGAASGRISITPGIGNGTHSFVANTAYFGAGTSKSELTNYVQNAPYATSSNGSKTLSFDVVGSVTSPDYPSQNLLTAHATVRPNSNGGFTLDRPTPAGTQQSRTFKTESAAMQAGRTALSNFIDKQYTGRRRR